MPALLKGVVQEASAGQIKVRANNGKVFVHQTKDTFRYAQRVIVFFDYHKFKVVRIVDAKQFELGLNKPPDEPEHDPDETTVEVEESESESSLPLRVGDGFPDVESESDSESGSSFQLFESEFGAVPDELD